MGCRRKRGRSIVAARATVTAAVSRCVCVRVCVCVTLLARERDPTPWALGRRKEGPLESLSIGVRGDARAGRSRDTHTKRSRHPSGQSEEIDRVLSSPKFSPSADTFSSSGDVASPSRCVARVSLSLCLSVALSLSLTHTHTHTLSLSLSLSLVSSRLVSPLALIGLV